MWHNLLSKLDGEVLFGFVEERRGLLRLDRVPGLPAVYRQPVRRCRLQCVPGMRQRPRVQGPHGRQVLLGYVEKRSRLLHRFRLHGSFRMLVLCVLDDRLRIRVFAMRRCVLSVRYRQVLFRIMEERWQLLH